MAESEPYCKSHPIDEIPFEALYHGSWLGVYRLSIKNGGVSARFNYRGSEFEDSIQGDYIRLRSRKARAFDCLHLLKPGVDVCVLSAHCTATTSDHTFQKPLLSWYDAKITSIKRAPHADRCICLFSVMVYQRKTPTILGKSLVDRWAEVVTIDNIAILQKLTSEPCEDEYYHWNSSEDCISCSKSKLLSGTFSSEISWMIVLSVLRRMEFDIKLVQSKIMHHCLNLEQGPSSITDAQSDGNSCNLSLSCEDNIAVLRFQICKENVKPKILSFIPVAPKEIIVPDRIIVASSVDSKLNSDSDVEILYDQKNLRHSKRQKMAPDRFISHFPQRSNRRSIRNETDDTKRLEQQRSLTPNASRTSLLFEEELHPDMSNCSISQSSSKHGQCCSPAEVLQEKSISERKPSVVYSKLTVISDVEKVCRDQHIYKQRRKKAKGLSRAERGTEISPSHIINHLSPRLGQKKCSQRKKLLSSVECKKMVESCMGDIMFEMEKGTQSIPQWTANQPITVPEERLYFNWSSSSESPDEADEHGDLWKEMEHSLAAVALIEQKQQPDFDISGSVNISTKDGQQPCQHDYKLNEEIGQVCQICNFISEIRYVLPPFMQVDGSATWKETFSVTEKDLMGANFLETNPCNEGSSWEISHSEGYDNVWTSIPVLRSKLHLHQKNAFEFVWRNIAGSLKPEDMNHESEDAGGCVIAHSPGSGKTLLVIAFLISYLKLFPKRRPLILCPKVAVYIWCKEFEKWGFPFPVYQIHPVVSYKKEMWDCKNIMPSSDNRKPRRKVMHIMDCLLKLRQWHEHPSIVLMSYPSFFSLARQDSKLEYQKFIADMLQNSPGLLILDEGHNPRSTHSKLRKLLMKVHTEFRILLSGTLFQNNFEEYFNTVSLARPRFINDAISKLDPDMANIFSRRNKKRAEKMSRKEKLARKLFVEKVGQKIESSLEDEREHGFDLLNRITSGFIDMHGGDTSDVLPGLQIYTILLTSTDLQQEILEKLHRSIKHKRCPLELELLITFCSIHPWLTKTVACFSTYFNADDLKKIENCKGNFGSGSKVKFVIDLVHKSTIIGERVLIFCHNISPINFLVEIFHNVFGWVIDEEVLVLKGEQELPVRAKIMEKFNGDNEGRCKVLLASTTACSEAINLVAASRLILLDSEWNHAKTTQAIARAFRPGQERIVYVYRLLASGTWEEDKYDSNAWKSWLAKMIFTGKYYKYSPSRQVDDIGDEILKELVEEDSKRLFQRIMKYD